MSYFRFFGVLVSWFLQELKYKRIFSKLKKSCAMASRYKTLFGPLYCKGDILQSYHGQRYVSKYNFNCAEQMDLH